MMMMMMKNNVGSHGGPDNGSDSDAGAENWPQIMKEFQASREQPGANLDDPDQDEAGEEEEVIEAIYHLMECHEAGQASLAQSDADLAREVADTECNTGMEPGIDEDESWTNEQEKETMELERARSESELALRVLNRGDKIQGKHFVDVANKELAETWWNRRGILVGPGLWEQGGPAQRYDSYCFLFTLAV